MAAKDISRSTVKRLPTYLSYLKSIPADGPTHISATALAAALGMGEVQVRKDLALVSAGGRPKIGYLREGLIRDLEEFLGYGNTNDAVLVGAGKLGQALLQRRRLGFDFAEHPRDLAHLRGVAGIAHAHETLAAGDNRADPALVEILAKGAPESVEWLKKIGVKFRPGIYQIYGGLWPRCRN